jgi:hypothetical protein
MDVLVGVILGFILGSKIGPLDFDEIQEAWTDLQESEETQQIVGGMSQLFMQFLRHYVNIVMGRFAPGK